MVKRHERVWARENRILESKHSTWLQPDFTEPQPRNRKVNIKTRRNVLSETKTEAPSAVRTNAERKRRDLGGRC